VPGHAHAPARSARAHLQRDVLLEGCLTLRQARVQACPHELAVRGQRQPHNHAVSACAAQAAVAAAAAAAGGGGGGSGTTCVVGVHARSTMPEFACGGPAPATPCSCAPSLPPHTHTHTHTHTTHHVRACGHDTRTQAADKEAQVVCQAGCGVGHGRRAARRRQVVQRDVEEHLGQAGVLRGGGGVAARALQGGSHNHARGLRVGHTHRRPCAQQHWRRPAPQPAAQAAAAHPLLGLEHVCRRGQQRPRLLQLAGSKPVCRHRRAGGRAGACAPRRAHTRAQHDAKLLARP
jgi:hypothetical protein